MLNNDYNKFLKENNEYFEIDFLSVLKGGDSCQ